MQDQNPPGVCAITNFICISFGQALYAFFYLWICSLFHILFQSLIISYRLPIVQLEGKIKHWIFWEPLKKISYLQMTFDKLKDGQGSWNSASGANSLTRTNFKRFFLITCGIWAHEQDITLLTKETHKEKHFNLYQLSEELSFWRWVSLEEFSCI